MESRSFGGSGARVDDGSVGHGATAKGLDVVDTASERVGDSLEHEASEGRAGVGVDPLVLAILARQQLLSIGRRREQVDASIQQSVRTDIVGARHAQHREEAHLDHRLAYTFGELIPGKVALIEVDLHESFVALGDHFHQRFARCHRRFLHVIRHIADGALAVAVGGVCIGLHVEEVDHPGEVVRLADRQLEGHDLAPERIDA